MTARVTFSPLEDHLGQSSRPFHYQEKSEPSLRLAYGWEAVADWKDGRPDLTFPDLPVVKGEFCQ